MSGVCVQIFRVTYVWRADREHHHGKAGSASLILTNLLDSNKRIVKGELFGKGGETLGGNKCVILEELFNQTTCKGALIIPGCSSAICSA